MYPSVPLNLIGILKITLKDFLGHDESALKEVIKSFIESSIENLEILETAIDEKNTEEIKSIAHRIAPMFKQIEARDIGTILKTLEQNNLETADLKDIYIALKAKTTKLFTALEQEIV